MDNLDWAIETQAIREKIKNLEVLATAMKNRAATHRAGLGQASKGDYDYLEGLADAYEICYNQITEILEGDKNA